jgi:4-amino-4-deoxy-L-arabinose transferase-like glycosyltransferase
MPYLNGVRYSHKPPLLCWLYQPGWRLFGVNAWWPRLVPALNTSCSPACMRRSR